MFILRKVLLYLLLFLLFVYQKIISDPLKFMITGSTNTCRFYPSCGEYAKQALLRHGVIKGTGLVIIRLCKCHPFHTGGTDLVP